MTSFILPMITSELFSIKRCNSSYQNHSFDILVKYRRRVSNVPVMALLAAVPISARSMGALPCQYISDYCMMPKRCNWYFKFIYLLKTVIISIFNQLLIVWTLVCDLRQFSNLKKFTNITVWRFKIEKWIKIECFHSA